MKRAVWRAAGIAVLVLLVIWGGRKTSVEASSLAKVTVSARTQHREAYEALAIINKARKSAGLKPLKMDKTLLGNALTRARECSVYYSHKRANGKAWHTVITKDYTCAGENIGFGFATAEAVTEAWMDSPSHRKNIMDGRYTCVGIGCVAVDGVTYWAQEFTDGRAKKVSRPADQKKNVKVAVSDKCLSVRQIQYRRRMHKGESGSVFLILENAGYRGLTIRTAASGVKYSTSDRTVVTVTSGGKIRAVGTGKASVRVKLAGNGRVYQIYKITVVK